VNLGASVRALTKITLFFIVFIPLCRGVGGGNNFKLLLPSRHNYPYESKVLVSIMFTSIM
jgi:hypothetical protein